MPELWQTPLVATSGWQVQAAVPLEPSCTNSREASKEHERQSASVRQCFGALFMAAVASLYQHGGPTGIPIAVKLGLHMPAPVLPEVLTQTGEAVHAAQPSHP